MGETQEKRVILPVAKPSHKYRLRLKAEEDVGGSGLGLQSGKAIHVKMGREMFVKP